MSHDHLTTQPPSVHIHLARSSEESERETGLSHPEHGKLGRQTGGNVGEGRRTGGAHGSDKRQQGEAMETFLHTDSTNHTREHGL